MVRGPKEIVKFRRERELKTDYKTRLALMKSRGPRMVVRISNKNVICQIIVHGLNGDAVLASGTSKELAKLGWKGARSNASACYLTGYLCGKKAKKAKVDKAILDTGFKTIIKGSNMFAALKGALDAGIDIPHDKAVLPTQERLDGAHINDKIKAQVLELKKKIDSI